MRVQATVNLKHTSTVAELKDLLTEVPDHATIAVRSYVADRPGELSSSTITFTWDTRKS